MATSENMFNKQNKKLLGGLPDPDHKIGQVAGGSVSITAPEDCIMTYTIVGQYGNTGTTLLMNGTAISWANGFNGFYIGVGIDSSGNLIDGGVTGIFVKEGTTISTSGYYGIISLWKIKEE